VRPLTALAARRLTGTEFEVEFPRTARDGPIGAYGRCEDEDSDGGAAVARVGEEAAGLLGIGRTTLYELIRQGDVRPIRIGRCVRIPQRELEAYVDRLVAETSSDR
jgi:excisionase family DNA binding protein